MTLCLDGNAAIFAFLLRPCGCRRRWRLVALPRLHSWIDRVPRTGLIAPLFVLPAVPWPGHRELAVQYGVARRCAGRVDSAPVRATYPFSPCGRPLPALPSLAASFGVDASRGAFGAGAAVGAEPNWAVVFASAQMTERCVLGASGSG